MRVRMIRTAAGPSGTFQAGVDYDLAEEHARALIAARAAVPVRLPPETAAVAAPETASKRPASGQKRRRRKG